MIIWRSLLYFHDLTYEGLVVVADENNSQLILGVIDAGLGADHSCRARDTRL